MQTRSQTAYSKNCPICGNLMPRSDRYPKSICSAHYGECFDSEGNKVTFVNCNEFGGFESIHTIGDTLVYRNDGICYVRDKKCRAGEAYFGGIVVQLLE
jgi:hypothetical protein